MHRNGAMPREPTRCRLPCRLGSRAEHTSGRPALNSQCCPRLAHRIPNPRPQRNFTDRSTPGVSRFPSVLDEAAPGCSSYADGYHQIARRSSDRAKRHPAIFNVLLTSRCVCEPHVRCAGMYTSPRRVVTSGRSASRLPGRFSGASWPNRRSAGLSYIGGPPAIADASLR